jgi:hypothetical protein
LVFAIILNVEGSNCITKINSSLLISNSSNEEGDVNNNNDFSNQGARMQQLPQQQQPQQQQQQDVDTQSQEALMQQSYELRKYCFLVTNLYVYSLFGIIIGFIILVLWFMRYKKIWSWKKADPTN